MEDNGYRTQNQQVLHGHILLQVSKLSYILISSSSWRIGHSNVSMHYRRLEINLKEVKNHVNLGNKTVWGKLMERCEDVNSNTELITSHVAFNNNQFSSSRQNVFQKFPKYF